MALVLQPSAMATAMALWKLARLSTRAGVQVVPHHVDDAPAAGRRHARVVGIGRGDAAGAGQGQAQGLGQRHHGGGGAHGHAGAGAAGDAAFHRQPLRLG